MTTEVQVIRHKGLDYEVDKIYAFADNGTSTEIIYEVLLGINGNDTLPFKTKQGAYRECMWVNLYTLGRISNKQPLLVDCAIYSFWFRGDYHFSYYLEDGHNFLYNMQRISVEECKDIVRLIPEGGYPPKY